MTRPPFSTSTKVVVLLFLLFLTSQLLIGMILGPVVGKDLAALQTVALVEPQVFRSIVKTWGPDEINRFERHFVVDFIFHPVIYSTFLSAWMCFEAERNLDGLPLGLPFWLSVMIVFLGGIFDVFENTIHYGMLPNLANAKDNDIRLAALFANVKWLICGSTVIWCVRMALTRLLIGRKLRQQQRQEEEALKAE